MSAMHAAIVIGFGLIFCASEFIVGRDFFRRLGIPGRSIWWIGPIVTAALALLWTPLWAIGAAWAIWRGLFGWGVTTIGPFRFGSRMDPQTWADWRGLLARNIVSCIPALIAFLYIGTGLILPVAGLLAFSVFATACNSWLTAKARRGQDVDPQVDALHGLGWGVMTGLVLMAS